MNNTTALAENSAPSASTVEFRDGCSLAMDQAIGIGKEKASWFAPGGKLFKATAQAIGFCVEMRWNWFSLWSHLTLHEAQAYSNSELCWMRALYLNLVR